MRLISLIPRRNKILFIDNIHLHRKNYTVLFNACHSLLYKIVIHRKNRSMKLAHGKYEGFEDKLAELHSHLSSFDQKELYQCEWKGIKIFPLVKAEMLSYLITMDNWFGADIPSIDQFIFEKAYKENHDVLLYNMAAAYYWLRHWHQLLCCIRKLKICVMFSGSLIYMKALNALLQNTPVSVFKTEHFFTGNAFYFEEKYTPIANLSDVSYPTCYRKLTDISQKWSVAERSEKIKQARHLYCLGQNKNVKQPDSNAIPLIIDESKKYLLIIGQVLNDFSILESHTHNFNSIRRYQHIIEQLLKITDYHIIFKAHPWERQKTHLKKPVTMLALKRYVGEHLSLEEQGRIHIVESININVLYKICTYVIGITSQGLLEAGFQHKKAVVLGEAFFSRKGFTHDYLNDEPFIEALIKKESDGILNENEYSDFLLFMALMFDVQLVQHNWRGLCHIRRRIKESQQ